MQQLTNISQSLEIRGPRDQPWRPLATEMFQEANRLTESGRTYEALLCAQDLYVSKHGDMHGVDFRVVTREVTVSILGAFDLKSLALYAASNNNSGT